MDRFLKMSNYTSLQKHIVQYLNNDFIPYITPANFLRTNVFANSQDTFARDGCIDRNGHLKTSQNIAPCKDLGYPWVSIFSVPSIWRDMEYKETSKNIKKTHDSESWRRVAMVISSFKTFLCIYCNNAFPFHAKSRVRLSLQ